MTKKSAALQVRDTKGIIFRGTTSLKGRISMQPIRNLLFTESSTWTHGNSTCVIAMRGGYTEDRQREREEREEEELTTSLWATPSGII